MAELGLGTASAVDGYGIGSDVVDRESFRGIVRDALAAGVRYVDTAVEYGFGEDVLGELAENVAACAVRVCTKVTEAHLATGIDVSLARLRDRAVDTVLLYRGPLYRDYARDLTEEELAAMLLGLKARGQARRTGASTYGLDDALSALREPWCDTVQVEHSILNPAVVASVRQRTRAGQEVVGRTVLCKGLLTSRRHLLPRAFGPLVSVADELEDLASAWGFTLPELAIRYALDTPGVDVVLVGVSSPAELETALAAWRHSSLTSWQMARLAHFDRSGDDLSHPERWETVDGGVG